MALAKAQVERIMRSAGAERISSDAIDSLAALLKERAEEVSEDAIAIAKHAGRKTITSEDVRLAGKK